MVPGSDYSHGYLDGLYAEVNRPAYLPAPYRMGFEDGKSDREYYYMNKGLYPPGYYFSASTIAWHVDPVVAYDTGAILVRSFAGLEYCCDPYLYTSPIESAFVKIPSIGWSNLAKSGMHYNTPPFDEILDKVRSTMIYYLV